MTCDARIRPFPGTTEVACELDGPHRMHSGTVRYTLSNSVTVIEWAEDDRRTFHGEWPGECDSAGCVLPAGHRGDHAR